MISYKSMSGNRDLHDFFKDKENVLFFSGLDSSTNSFVTSLSRCPDGLSFDSVLARTFGCRSKILSTLVLVNRVVGCPLLFVRGDKIFFNKKYKEELLNA